eukprot:TRINITY_DN974_c1_g1_i1.p1 TRINITY_DN974_c1_g1~~TRINITY_DN974_c1_g1_i1.p1  ORF type:complete len:316 (+),score=40.35 TRINITY_DN974_c1_g1_i1:67-1014(+)
MSRQDFHWVGTEEPHKSRRVEILKAHGKELQELMRPEWRTAPICVVLVTIQIAVAIYSVDWSWSWWLATAYIVGGTINHALFLAIHEIVHMLAFRGIWPNNLLACFANIPIGIPYCSTFHGYHMDHHKLQGTDGVDTDLPTQIEGKLVQGVFMKLMFCVGQILFYALRPMLVANPKISTWTAISWLVQISSMLALYETTGSLTPWFYLIMSTFFAGCLHPVSGHFLSEHYEFVEGTETYSYYGPLNYLAFNVGYHNEHHDFPNIPWSGLPRVKEIAPEFYDHLPQTKSWPGTIYDFITQSNMSAFSRVKRRPKKD